MDEISLLTLALAKKYTDEHGGGGGTTDYDDLSNKPQIAGTTLSGNKSLADLGIASAQSVSNITNGENINNFAGVETALDGVGTALATKQNATDNSLDTDAKTIVGAINEHEGDISSLKSGLTNLDNEVNGDATTYPYADVITINDAVPSNLADCSVKIEPVQDLHGQSAPYVGGAGKNKLPLVLADIKTANTQGTWDGNTYTLNGASFTFNTDNGGNITSITVPTGTTTGATGVVIGGSPSDYLVENTGYAINGCPAGGSAESSYYMCFASTWTTGRSNIDEGQGSTIASFNPSDYEGKTFRIAIRSGYTIPTGGLTFYPMIRLSTETDATFAPYTNICPITGHTEVDVQRDGKNVLPSTLAIIKAANTNGTWANNVYSYNGVDFTVNTNTDGYVTSIIAANAATTANSSALYIPMPKDNNKYLFNGGADTDHNIIVWDATTNARAKEWDDTTNSETSTGSTLLEVSNVSDHNLTVRCRVSSGVAAGSKTFYPMVCQSFTTDPTFVPYAGKTYTIALGDTIYGGTVDFDSGVMTVDRACFKITNINQIARNATYPTAQYKITAITEFVADSSKRPIADRYATGSGYGTINFAGSTTKVIRITTAKEYESLEAAFEEIDGTEVCYYIEPFTVQLTPQQIQLLQGQNTLTASTGQISVTVNGVAGSIGQVQEQVNELAEEITKVHSFTGTTSVYGVLSPSPSISVADNFIIGAYGNGSYVVTPFVASSDNTWRFMVLQSNTMTPLAEQEATVNYVLVTSKA